MIKQDEILKSFKEGRLEAFDELYHHYRERIYLGAFKLIKSHELAQEILQDVFMKIWENRNTIDLSKNFQSYIFRIMRTTSYDYFRKIALDQERLDSLIIQSLKMQSASAESDIFFKEANSRLEQVLLQLPEKCREVYVLCKLEGRSHQEVSELLNVSPATVNNHIVKASRLIRNHFKPEFYIFLLFFINT